MSETSPEPNANAGGSTASEETSGAGKRFTQEEVNSILANEKRKVQERYADYDDLKAKAQRLKAAEDADKSEREKLAEQLQAAQAEGSQSKTAQMRLEVALDKAPEGMPLAQLRKLAKRLSGSTKEELEADAAELFEEFVPKSGDGGQGNQAPKSRPTELREGSGAASQPEEDVKKIADEVLGDR